MTERTIPFNEEAEQGVLGSLLIDPDAVDLVFDRLSANDFYCNAHRVLYQAMKNVVQAGAKADFLTVCDELMRTDKMEQVSRNDKTGTGYITSLINEVPTSGNVEYYAEIILRLAEARRLIHAAGQIAALAYSGEANVLEQAEQLLFQLHRTNRSGAGFTPMSSIMTEYMEELDYLQTHRGSIVGVPTGYKDIDIMLGGLQKSDLILLAGRPSMGKTAAALCIGYNAARLGKKVAVFSLEMGKRLLARRLMAMHSKVDQQRLRAGWVEDDEWDTVMGAAQVLSGLPMWIDDTAGSPIASMRSKMRRLIQEQGGIDLMIVDYLGLIEPDVDASKRDNLVQQISTISKGLKMLAREFDIPVLTLCQLSRAVESRQEKKPMLSDLRDSGSLEQDCDVCLFIYREDYYKPDTERKNLADILIAKHRNGPVGEVALYFKRDQTMFYNLDEIPGQQ